MNKAKPAYQAGRQSLKHKQIARLASRLVSMTLAITAISIIFSINSAAQPKQTKSLTNASLLFPIKPGIPNTLAGSMGELRSSHFHTGIDIRTGGQEGLPVLAADEGYVSRVKVKPTGYGNTIYIKHPNGHTTVYAHLKSFTKKIADYVRQKQYERKTFAIDLYLDKHLFSVNQGDIIALSGNSGSSGGPHVHFDVRNRNQDLLNPLHYGFTEIIDTRPPLAKRLALVTTTKESRVNGEFGRIEIPFEYNKNNYFINDTIYALGKIGLELYAYDRMNNTRFKTGINKIEVSVNNKIYLITTIETWPFSKSRQFYTYVNYEAMAKTGKRYHKLYVDDGNKLPFYTVVTNRGYLLIAKGKTYQIKIKLMDSHSNKSVIDFVIKGKYSRKYPLKNSKMPAKKWEVKDNTLILKTAINDTLLVDDNKLAPSYTVDSSSIYLIDLKESIPKSYFINGVKFMLPIKAYVQAGTNYTFYHPLADIRFSKSTLFKHLYLTLYSSLDSATGFEIITIGNSNIPLNKNYSVTFKPSNLPANKQYLAVYGVWGKNSSFVGGQWKGDQISFRSRNFGSYTLLADSIPPFIKPLILTKDEMVFKITDNLSGIKKITMHVNNQWVLMNYDPKQSLIWAEKPKSGFTFMGTIELKVIDNIGNEGIHSTEIN